MRRPAVVTMLGTLGALGACSGGAKQTPTANPPAPEIQVDRAPAPEAAAERVAPGAPEPPGDLTRFTRVLNSAHAEHGRVYRSENSTCYVRLPFPEGSGPPVSFRPPPTVAVDCPSPMNDPAWDACADGSALSTPEADACLCAVFGNPPPPPRSIVCPPHEY